MFRSSGHLTFDHYISYKCQRMASTASKRENAKYHRKNRIFHDQSHKRGCPGGWGQENHSVYKALAFLVILRSKRLSRSSRLLRSSWLMEPMRPLRSSDSLKNFNSIIKWLETSYFVVFKTLFFLLKSWNFKFNFGILQTRGCGGEAMSFM